jgi:hypothetical protein
MGSISARLRFLIYCFANNAGGLQVHRRPPPPPPCYPPPFPPRCLNCRHGGVIGASGEAVEAGALRPRVDVFCRKSMRGGLQPLPLVATQWRRRDIAIMTCLMSQLKRALLPQREVAARRGVVKYSFSSVTCAHSDGSSANPPHAIEDRRPDIWSLGRGMGIFGWGGYLALLQGDATDNEGDGFVSSSRVFFVAVGQFVPPGSAKLAILATSDTRK